MTPYHPDPSDRTDPTDPTGTRYDEPRGSSSADSIPTAELEARVRTLLRSVVDEAPVPPGLETRLRDAVAAEAPTGGRATRLDEGRGAPTGSSDGVGARRPWLPLVAAAAAALLVLGSVGWWAARRDRVSVVVPSGIATLPWDEGAMKRVANVPQNLLGRVTPVPAGTPACSTGDLEVVSSRTVVPSDATGEGLTTDVGLRSVASGPCSSTSHGGGTLTGPDGSVTGPGGTARAATGLPPGVGPVLGRGRYDPLVVNPGELVRVRVRWLATTARAHPQHLELKSDTTGGAETWVSIDVSGVHLPAPAPPTSSGDALGDAGPWPPSWEVMSVATAGTLASLTASVLDARVSGSLKTATLRLVNDTTTDVSLRPCPDLLVADYSEGVSDGMLRGPLSCEGAPAALRPGDQLDVGLRLPLHAPSGHPADPTRTPQPTLGPFTAQLVRGTDPVGASFMEAFPT